MIKPLLSVSSGFVMLISLSACFHSSDDADSIVVVEALSCSSSAQDSIFDGTNVVRIRSETVSPNTYQQITVRTGVTMDYMVHTSDNPKALLILIPGSQMNANIQGAAGQQATNAGGNFLIRSAHLFAAQGYKVVSIDRPSDWESFIDPTGSTSGSAFDGYRTSSEHFQDLQKIIEQENASPGLPVVIAGTSRGTISAVAQHNLADYILLSGPLTGGSKGSPIGTTGVLPSALGAKPVHLMWHAGDACFVTTPSDARELAGDFANVSAVEVNGGIDHPELSSRSSNQGCDGSKTHHGFLGIESCVVENAINWLDEQLETP